MLLGQIFLPGACELCPYHSFCLHGPDDTILGLGLGLRLGLERVRVRQSVFDANVGFRVQNPYGCPVTKVLEPLDQLDPSPKRDCQVLRVSARVISARVILDVLGLGLDVPGLVLGLGLGLGEFQTILGIEPLDGLVRGLVRLGLGLQRPV